MALPVPNDFSKPLKRYHWERCRLCGNVVQDDKPFKISECMTWLAGVSSHRIVPKK